MRLEYSEGPGYGRLRCPLPRIRWVTRLEQATKPSIYMDLEHVCSVVGRMLISRRSSKAPEANIGGSQDEASDINQVCMR